MTLETAGHCSWLAAIVVTASGGGCQPPCAIAVRICWNFTKPRPATSTAIAMTTKIIRFLMSGSSLSSCSIEVDTAFLNQRSGCARHLGACRPVVGKSRNFVEPRAGQVVLARQHQEVRRKPRVVSIALGRKLDLRRFAARPGRFDPLARRFQSRGGIENLGADGLADADQIRFGLTLDVPRYRGVSPSRAVSDRETQHQRHTRGVEIPPAERLEGLPETPVQLGWEGPRRASWIE